MDNIRDNTLSYIVSYAWFIEKVAIWVKSRWKISKLKTLYLSGQAEYMNIKNYY